MGTLLRQIFQQCKQTFCGTKVNQDYHGNMEKLLTLVKQLKPHDVNFDENLVRDKEKYVFSHSRAPVYYIHVFENQYFTMCIFVLKNGTRLPLHDHPHMTGILKG